MPMPKGFKHSEETKQKISESVYVAFKNNNTRAKLSEMKKGEKHWNYGKTTSDDVRLKISNSHKGKIISVKTKIKISKTTKGRQKPFGFGAKISESRGGHNNFYGTKHYRLVHNFVYKNMGKAYKCQKADETCLGRFEWANLSQEYKFDLSDWAQLCTSHHVRYDNNFKKEKSCVQ